MAGLTGGGGGGGGSPILVTQEAVSFGESNVSVAGNVSVVGGSVVLPESTDTMSRTNDDSNETDAWGGFRFEPTSPVTEVYMETSNNSGNASSFRIDRVSDGVTVASGGSGSSHRFTGLSLEAGVRYNFLADISSPGVFYDGSFPISTAHGDFVTGGRGTNASGGDYFGLDNFEVVGTSNSEAATVSFGSKPADLDAWDIITWQYDKGGGSVSFDVEVNDGSGWSTFAADVLPPVDIASVAETSDVRVVASLSRASAADTSPAVPYVARRGER